MIVTTDHNLRAEGYDRRHIPLFIKRPFQKNFKRMDKRVTTLNFLPFLKRFMEKGEVKEELLERN